jgi:hypothetical protein
MQSFSIVKQVLCIVTTIFQNVKKEVLGLQNLTAVYEQFTVNKSAPFHISML